MENTNKSKRKRNIGLDPNLNFWTLQPGLLCLEPLPSFPATPLSSNGASFFHLLTPDVWFACSYYMTDDSRAV